MSGINYNITTNKAANEDESVPAVIADSAAEVLSNSLGASAVVSTVFSNVAGGNQTQVASVQVAVTLAVESLCLIHYSGAALIQTADAFLGYQVNSDTPTVSLYVARADNNRGRVTNMFFADPIILPAGSHTIKLTASRATNNFTLVDNNTDGLFGDGKLRVTVLGPTGN
jgi:hypothetical protein